MRHENIVRTKSFAFAVRVVKLYQFLKKDFKEYDLSSQVLRSGTSIGASIRESEFAASKKDFIHKLTISLKEANETQYWLELLNVTGYLTKRMYASLNTGCEELIKLLVASIKTSKKSIIKPSLNILH